MSWNMNWKLYSVIRNKFNPYHMALGVPIYTRHFYAKLSLTLLFSVSNLQKRGHMLSFSKLFIFLQSLLMKMHLEVIILVKWLWQSINFSFFWTQNLTKSIRSFCYFLKKLKIWQNLSDVFCKMFRKISGEPIHIFKSLVIKYTKNTL